MPLRWTLHALRLHQQTRAARRSPSTRSSVLHPFIPLRWTRSSFLHSMPLRWALHTLRVPQQACIASCDSETAVPFRAALRASSGLPVPALKNFPLSVCGVICVSACMCEWTNVSGYVCKRTVLTCGDCRTPTQHACTRTRAHAHAHTLRHTYTHAYTHPRDRKA